MQNRIKKIVLALLFGIVGAVLIWQFRIVEIRTDSVTVRNAGVKLAGTLATPRLKPGPFPAVVIVHGSGRVRRSDVRDFIDKLVPEGYAVLTFDKRGVSKSAGVFINVTVANSEERIAELASDIEAAVRLLMENPAIDQSRIGLVGNGQAGWIMPIAANNSEDVSFFVALAGSAVTVGQQDFFSQLTRNSPEPFNGPAKGEIEEQVSEYDGPHGFDPLPVLREVKIPSLWLLGEKDKRVPTWKSMENIQMIDSAAVFDVRVIPNAGHDLRDVDSGKQYDYWSELLEFMNSI